jgi:hypothetical protein
MTDLGGGKNTIERRVPSVVPTADLSICMTVVGAAAETAAFRRGITGIVR